MAQGLSAGKAKQYYYEKEPILNPNGDGSNLRWAGTGAAALGLHGAVDKEVFGNILDGKSVDGQTQLRNTAHTTGNAVAVHDMTFSAPKSVSLLMSTQADTEVGKDILDAHRKAVDAVTEHMENNYANTQHTRTNEDGKKYKEHVNQGNLTIAIADHATARPSERDPFESPSLHSHVLVVNQVLDKKTGEYRALSAKEFYENQDVMNQIYKSELAKNLSEKNFELQGKTHGFDIKMDQKIIDAFSDRKADIDKEAANRGTTSKADRDKIQHENKKDKSDHTGAELKAHWDEKLLKVAEKTFGDLSTEAKGQNEYSLSKKEVLEKVVELKTLNEAVLTQRQILKAAVDSSYGNYTYNDLKAELNTVKKIGQKEGTDIKRLGVNKRGEAVFTNKNTNDIEKENLKMIKNQVKQKGILTKEQAEAGLKNFEDKNKFKLTEGQKAAAMSILASGTQLQAIQGVAGSGKTTMLKAINHALDFNKKNIEVTLLAPTNKAAQGAAAESKLKNGKEFEASTLASHIIQNSSAAKFDDEINGSAKKVEIAEATSFKTIDVKEKKSLDAELYIKGGSKAFEKSGGSLLNVNKGKEKGSIQSSSKHKKGRSTTVKGGKFDGAVKKEDWSKKGVYTSNIKFKDGSSFKTTIKSYGQDTLLGKVVSSGTKIEKFNSDGSKQKETSNTFLGATLKTKKVLKADSLQTMEIVKIRMFLKNLY